MLSLVYTYITIHFSPELLIIKTNQKGCWHGDIFQIILFSSGDIPELAAIIALSFKSISFTDNQAHINIFSCL